MKEVFRETTEGIVSGSELKEMILRAARDSEEGEEPEIEMAMYFYKSAAEIDVNARYFKRSTDVYYEKDKQD